MRVGVHQGSVLSPLIFAIVVDVATEHAREGLLNEILYANDLALMSESLEDLRERGEVSKVEKCVGRQGIESKS